MKGQTLKKNDTSYFSPWLFCPQSNPRASLRLFCFPYAGGNAMVFRNWHESLPASVEVCAVQLPGRGKRLNEPPFTTLSALIQPVTEAILRYTDKPFAFFGHSMGALISFELARQLRRESRRQPEHLFLSGRRAPQIPSPDPPTYDLPAPEFMESLRELKGTSAEVLEQPELMQLMLPLLRADFALCETYVYTPEPLLHCSLSVYGGSQDSGVKGVELEAWREQTSSAFSLRLVPGDHFFLNTSPSILLRYLSHELHHLVNGRVSV